MQGCAVFFKKRDVRRKLMKVHLIPKIADSSLLKSPLPALLPPGSLPAAGGYILLLLLGSVAFERSSKRTPMGHS